MTVNMANTSMARYNRIPVDDCTANLIARGIRHPIQNPISSEKVWVKRLPIIILNYPKFMLTHTVCTGRIVFSIMCSTDF